MTSTTGKSQSSSGRFRGGRGMVAVEEATLLARVGGDAGGSRAENAQPVAREELIKPVAHRAGENAKPRSEGPGPAESFGHADATLGFEPCDTVRDQDVGLVIVRIEAVMEIERVAEVGLRGQQAICCPVVMPENEPGPAGAQRAIAIKDDDRPIIGKFRNHGIVAIAVRVPHPRFTTAHRIPGASRPFRGTRAWAMPGSSRPRPKHRSFQFNRCHSRMSSTLLSRFRGSS